MHEIQETAQPGRLDEDLSDNLARVSAIALRHCNGCADYHVGFVARRLPKERNGGVTHGTAFERMATARLAVYSGSPNPIDVLVAGAADTGVSATAVRAAAAAGGDVLSRLRLTVIDQCPTPLELVRNYAAKVGIDVRTAAVDLVAPTLDFQSDVILVSSLFRYIPCQHHIATLRRMSQWLKPAGAIVFSSSVGLKDMEFQLKQRLGEEAELRSVLAQGKQPLSEPVADLIARVERERTFNHHISEYESLETLNGLFAAAGLAVVDQRTKSRRFGAAGERILSVLSRK